MALDYVALQFRVLKMLRATSEDMFEGTMYRGVHSSSYEEGDYTTSEEQEAYEAGIKDLVKEYQAAIFKAVMAKRVVGAVDCVRYGSYDPEQPTSATIQLGMGGSTCVIDLATDAGIAQLKLLAKPAPFGDLRTQETKVDESVRHAMRVDNASSIKCVFHYPFASEDNKFRAHKLIFKAVAPLSEITAFKPYTAAFPKLDWSHARINIYEVGGHFSRHVDTPSCGECIGTLVWALNPGGWEGGDLRVACSPSRTSSWSGTMLTPDTADPKAVFRAQGVMFYSDMPHQVMPVTAGVRVTLSVPLLATMEVDLEEDPDARCWRELLASQYLGEPSWDERIMRSVQNLSVGCAKLGLRCGLMLSHGYTASNVTAGMLKGVDVAVVDLVQRATKGAAQLTTVIVHTDESSDYNGGSLRRSVKVFAMDPKLVTSAASDLLASPTPCPPAKPSADRRAAMFVDLIDSVEASVGEDTEVALKYLEFMEHTGNESRPLELHGEYVRAALMLPFPV